MIKNKLKVSFFIFTAILTAGIFSDVYAQNAGFKEITAPEVKNIIDENRGVVIHVLSKIEYNIQHITGSINIPVINIKNTAKLPEDKNIPLVFYCMGKRWPYSKRAAGLAAAKGYKKVFAFIGGIPEWRRYNYPMTIDKDWQNIKVKKFSPIKLIQLLEKENIYLLDVRPLNFKRDSTFIAGASFCPLVFLNKRYTQIPKDKKIITTDWAMKQSTTAARFLKQKGYNVLGTLKGGLERWKQENHPVEIRDFNNVKGLLKKAP
jgi:rhodanese-related sulfurtransferase